MRSNTFQITVRCGGSGTLTQTGNRICWSSTVVTVCESKSHLQYGDVPREALHRLVQLPALQPFLHGQVMEVLVKFHRWEKKKKDDDDDENECGVRLYGRGSSCGLREKSICEVTGSLGLVTGC